MRQKDQVPVPEWAKNSVIYEVNLRQYSESGRISDFIPHLARLKRTGFDILWFMPVFPIGKKNRKGQLGSYYSIRDFRALNPELGTFSDFASLVSKAHDLGFKVLLDWVANHSSWDNELMFCHPEWYTKDSKGNVIVPEGTDWVDVADFDYSLRTLWNYKIDAMKFWVVEAGVDGFRCDVAGMVPTEFWAQAYKELVKVKPDIFMLAEWDDPVLHEHAFHMSYAWEIHKTFTAISRGSKKASDLEAEIIRDGERYLPDAVRMHFTSNHDENSWNGSEFERLGDAAPCFAALTYLLPGMPLVYSGQEAGNTRRLSFFDRDPIVWKPDATSDLYERLNKLKHSNPALWNGAHGGTWVRIHSSDPEVFVIRRKHGSDEVTGIFNLQAKGVEINLDSELQGDYLNLLGEPVRFDAGSSIQLEPWSFIILQPSQIDKG